MESLGGERGRPGEHTSALDENTPPRSAGWLTLAPETWRSDLLRIVLRFTAVIGSLVYIPSVFAAVRHGLTTVVALDTIALATLFSLAYFDRIPARHRAACACIVFYPLGAGLMITVGSISQIYLFTFSLLTTLLLSPRWGLATVALNAVTMLGIGFVGIAAPEMMVPRFQADYVGWSVVTGNFVFLNASLVLTMSAVIRALEKALGVAVTARIALEHEQKVLVGLHESQRLADVRHEKLAEQFRQAQKMETIGSLAGGIAHDFNNLMSVVLSYSEMLAEDLPANDPMRDDLSEIHRAGVRAADLTRQLLAFSRQQVLEPKVVDLSQVVGGLEKMLRRLIGEDIELAMSCAPGLGNALVDPGQIEQVIMNLVVNARDAMPRGGMLTIETARVVLGESYASEHVGVTSGPHVMLAVSDTGTGMDRATQARMFEPFFTTKDKGKGTGLGLATVFGIVKQSGGTIWVYSEPATGTTFKIYFPVAEEAAVASNTGPLAIRETVRGSETILLVEDEAGIRALTCTILRKQGYHVLEAQNGGEALLLCEQHTATIHLLLTDVVMPRMSGRQLAERLLPLRPDMKVLYMSGYTDDAVVRHGILDSTIAFVQKPITPLPLARKVREVLDGYAVTA